MRHGLLGRRLRRRSQLQHAVGHVRPTRSSRWWRSATRPPRQALSLIDHATPVEQALIEAIQARYPSAEPIEDCSVWNDDYANAMRPVYRDFGDDLDVAALFAEA